MYESLGHVQLKNGERVEAAAVTGPDPQWAPRVLDLLGHKGEIWTEQNRQAILGDLAIDVHYYLLHRDNVPLANVMIADLDGVGILGHVFTVPDDRRKGAALALFDKLMHHLRCRDGKALFLWTDFETPPYRLYEHYGFKGIEPGSGGMAWYATSRERFDAWYFEAGPTRIEPFGWAHWPASSPLTMGPWPGLVRCSAQQLYGRMSPEGLLLPLVMDNLQRAGDEQPPRGVALVKLQTGAVVRLAAWTTEEQPHGICLVDVYCHPHFWDRGGDLFDALEPPSECTLQAEVDADFQPKCDVLEAAGFKQVDKTTRQAVDVWVFARL